MKKSPLLLAGVVTILLLTMYGCSTYNGMVSKDEAVNQAWANVQSQYQRRSDLIPNLVNTVKGAAEFEKGTLTDVIQARANASGINLNGNDLTPENVAKFQAAQDQLSGALSRLLVTVEKYPDLKANQNFLDLQAQLEGTENRITVARNDFNATVKDYNQAVRTFPASAFASMFGFQPKGYFEATNSAQSAPTVSF